MQNQEVELFKEERREKLCQIISEADNLSYKIESFMAKYLGEVEERSSIDLALQTRQKFIELVTQLKIILGKK